MQPERHRAIVDQVNLHVGSEVAGGDAFVAQARAGGPHELGEALGTERRGSGRTEARPVAAARVGSERELGDQEERAPDVRERPVHPPLLVGEHAVGDDAFEEPVALRRGVLGLDADEHQKAAADGGDDGSVDDHRSARDPLQ